jgi:hypothetical protein
MGGRRLYFRSRAREDGLGRDASERARRAVPLRTVKRENKKMPYRARAPWLNHFDDTLAGSEPPAPANHQEQRAEMEKGAGASPLF